MTRRRAVLIGAGGVAGVLLAVVIASVLVLRSSWFYSKVRERIIATIETATGGRAEIGLFQFDPAQLHVQVGQFVLHGTEEPGKPPLFRAASISLGLKITSLLHRDVDIQYVDVKDPRVYLIVYPDGHTNIPKPKVRRRGERSAVESLINLAIGRFSLQNGIVEVESRGSTPFDASGRNLSARFVYEITGPRYRGDISIQPLDLRWGGEPALPLGVHMAVTFEKNRIGISSGRATTGDSSADFSGTLDDLAPLRGTFQYDLRASVADVSRIFHLRGLERGTVQVGGNAVWAGGANLTTTGTLHATGVGYRSNGVRLEGFRGDGAVRADSQSVDVSGLRIAGETVNAGTRLAVQGRIGNIAVRGNDLQFTGASVSALGGMFTGEGRLRGWDRLEVRGNTRGLEAKRAVSAYSREPLPWNSLVSGPIELEASLRRPNDFRLAANLTLEPAAGSPPVRGQIAARYDSHTGVLDLGRSTVELPASRAELSGAIGQQILVHLETRDLNEFLPVLGESAGSLPIKLANGSAIFDGTVTGQTADPRIAGRLTLRRFVYAGELIESLDTNVNASSRNVALSSAALVWRGALRAQLEGVLGLQDWKVTDASAISANATVRNAPLGSLVAALGRTDIPAAGLLNVTGQVRGTVRSPVVSSDLEIAKGQLEGEPFDRFAAHLEYSGRTARLTGGQLTAGAKQLRLQASFDHLPNDLAAGRLRFQVQSNVLPLDQIAILERARPGVKGTLQITASGEADLTKASNRAESFRIATLQADVTGRDLQLTGQALGNAHLTANSEGSVLRARLDSNFAGSTIQGIGQWTLAGDYPGNATLTFSRVDLAQLRAWIAPKSAAPLRFSGSTQGELAVNGPALKPELLKAELRLPTLELGPAPGVQVIPGAASFALHNSGPVVATLANSVVTIDAARLVGPSTDVTLGGRVLLQQKNPLDLRINGHLDVAVLHDFDRQITSSGQVSTEATIRGALDSPQVNGRLELQNAAFNYSDLPNGITNANGVIVFTGDRATIQTLSAETGGGKVRFFGFGGYTAGDFVFRLHANADMVRVRYPAGVSTVANASLTLSGTADRSMLDGTITVLRSSFNVESDFTSLLAKSAEPVRVPAARAGFLGGLNFDIQIDTSPDIELESALTQGLQAEANLRLRGTAASPALLGRITITQGQLVFFGTKYVINQGSIEFFNPVKIEPVLNIDLETKARGIDITLTVSGPLNKLNLTPRSDPPLQFSEIVSLLATGRAPTTDARQLALQSSTAMQPFQQSAATALLGQVIANPVSGRLQRFFGISKVRIDPTLPGIQYNPQARLTLEQQVTPDVTLTYITNVTSANPQVVSVEWSVNKRWSVVALREENGLLGLDFFYKTRFK